MSGDSSTITWSPKLRELVFPTRAAPNPEYLPRVLAQISSKRPNVFPFAVAETWQKARDWNHEREIDRVRTGLSSAPQDLRALIARALTERERMAPPDAPLEVDVEAATVALELAHTWSIVPYWIAKEGVDFALRALVRTYALEPSHNKHNYGPRGVWFEESWDFMYRVDAKTKHAWQVLRACLATVEDDVYAEARATAEGLRARMPLGVRTAIGFAFPDEPAWANDDARAVLAEAPGAIYDVTSWPGDVRRILVNADAALAVRLAERELYVEDDSLATLLARHGNDAIPIFGALLAAAKKNDLRKRYAPTFALVASPEAALLLVQWLENKAIAPIVRKYLKQHPDLARTALETTAMGQGSLARTARIALDALNVSPSRRRRPGTP